MKLSGISFLGNKEILKAHKTAFLCSRKCPAEVIIECYDWALEQREKGNCVMSGFHSQIEKDVFNILSKGNQPMIMVLARGMRKRWGAETKAALAQERLLILTPFPETAIWTTAENAKTRNRLMMELADEIRIAHARKGGSLEKLVREVAGKNIRIGLE